MDGNASKLRLLEGRGRVGEREVHRWRTSHSFLPVREAIPYARSRQPFVHTEKIVGVLQRALMGEGLWTLLVLQRRNQFVAQDPGRNRVGNEVVQDPRDD